MLHFRARAAFISPSLPIGSKEASNLLNGWHGNDRWPLESCWYKTLAEWPHQDDGFPYIEDYDCQIESRLTTCCELENALPCPIEVIVIQGPMGGSSRAAAAKQAGAKSTRRVKAQIPPYATWHCYEINPAQYCTVKSRVYEPENEK